MSIFNRFTALRWIYNVIVPPSYRDKLAITDELCALERTLNKVIDVTNANGQALEAITKDLENIQLGTGGYYSPTITDNGDGTITLSFVASDDSMPPIEDKTFFLGDMRSITEMLQGFNGDPMEVKNYIDQMSGGYYTPVFVQNGNTVEVSFVASNTMLPALDVYSLTLPVGPSGKSAYEIAVDNGFKGSVEDFFASLKGDPYTLTESDKNSIVQSVLEALGGQPVAGYFDENNNIVLTSALADGTYTIKLVKGDGTYNLGTVTVNTANTPIEPTYENLADPASADWKEGYRLSISSGSVSVLAGHTTTNFIPCAMGNTLRIKGMKITGSVGGTNDGSDFAKIVMYNSEKAKIGGLYGHGSVAEQMYTAKVTTDGDWTVYTILLDNNDKQWATDQLRYIRIDGKLTGAASDVVINIIPA